MNVDDKLTTLRRDLPDSKLAESSTLQRFFDRATDLSLELTEQLLADTTHRERHVTDGHHGLSADKNHNNDSRA